MLTERVDALSELLGLSRTRVSHEALDGAGELLERVGDRRRLSADHTVVALAGATGSGKSSLFNALTGLELSRIGVRRPTTSAPVACAWDPRGASGLLDRLGIAPKARFARHSALDAVAERTDDGPAGLVLLDLPDHDSAATAHRDQVDRVLKLVDVIVWVLDPEKYADAALHERYLRPLAGHADVTIVVLNQIDRLPEEAVEQVLDDLRRLLDDDGLAVGEHGEDGAMVMAVSALSGDGVPELRAAVGQVVAERAAASRRLSADVDGLAERLRPLYVAEGVTGLTDRAREDFTASLAHAVGAAAAGRAAERAWARAADEACGTPWRQLRRVRGTGRGEDSLDGRRPALSASRASVDEAVRAVAAEAVVGLPAPWAQAVREAARRGGRTLPEALDAAVERAAPDEPPRPRWWSVVGTAQWLLALLATAALVSGTVTAAGVLPLPWWLPPVLLAVGALGGPLLTRVSRFAARGPARRHGQAAERRMADAAADCGRARVLEPLAAELLRYREVREQYGVLTGNHFRMTELSTAGQ
ncbi:GTPase [Actinacidiphila glaucinigra]|uniref:GTPase n=1 Tax=Actinacidiphila glaucinigra TaxID=235986 RepID=UPI002E33E8C7|nr:GTPase [Actinacidiphila glaucinigra]